METRIAASGKDGELEIVAAEEGWAATARLVGWAGWAIAANFTRGKIPKGRCRGIPPLRTERARMGHPRARF